jgi:hypothetical protein
MLLTPISGLADFSGEYEPLRAPVARARKHRLQ